MTDTLPRGRPPRSCRAVPRGKDSLPTHTRDGTGHQGGPTTTVPRHMNGSVVAVRTAEFPTSLLRAVTSWGKSWGGVGSCAQLIPHPPHRLLSPQGYK